MNIDEKKARRDWHKRELERLNIEIGNEQSWDRFSEILNMPFNERIALIRSDKDRVRGVWKIWHDMMVMYEIDRLQNEERLSLDGAIERVAEDMDSSFDYVRQRIYYRWHGFCSRTPIYFHKP